MADAPVLLHARVGVLRGIHCGADFLAESSQVWPRFSELAVSHSILDLRISVSMNTRTQSFYFCVDVVYTGSAVHRI